MRPLGIAALEDKIVQRAVTQVLNAVYEVVVLRFSYGCRPGSGPHGNVNSIWPHRDGLIWPHLGCVGSIRRHAE